MDDSRSSRLSPSFETALVVFFLAALSAWAVSWFHQQGFLLYYGDAAAHLNIARRIIDSRTPGFAQIGTVWLPLPHLLMLPLVGDDQLWRSGLAGAIPSALAFIASGAFLHAAVRSLTGSGLVAAAALALFALNPNMLYLQAIPMTEAVWFGCFFALVYFTIRFRRTQSALSVVGAGVALMLGTLTRYEAWFLIPFVTLYFLIASKRRRFRYALLFGAVASLGPLSWLAHNYWYYQDALEFYRGPWSAKAIYQRSLDQGMQRYRGDGEWGNAVLYFSAAARLCAGWGLVGLAAAGMALSLWKRLWWPLALTLLPPVFYIWSVYSSGTPIFVPHLWPNAWYNTRYGMAALPMLVLAAMAVVWIVPRRLRWAVAPTAVLIALSPWIAAGGEPESWICWKESQVNSDHRRAWTAQAAAYLSEHYRGGGILTSFGDLT
ncbi:MAG: hypothetical protein GY953_12250, partial [bacterium]|nr:hypothetical protein [bacterium]